MEVNKIYNTECIEGMKQIQSQSVDLILCDLPYGATQNRCDRVIPFDKMWEQYSRIIKETGVIALFAQGIFYVDLVNSNRKLFKYDEVWDKVLVSGFLNAKHRPLRQHEQLAIFYDKVPTYNPQFHVGQPLHSKGRSYKEKEPTNENYGHFKQTGDTRAGSTEKYPTTIRRFQKPHPRRALHRTEKSVAHCREIIRTFTNCGDLVLDNCCGCGTIPLAAAIEKRNYIGMDYDVCTRKNSKYFGWSWADVTRDRIADLQAEQASRKQHYCKCAGGDIRADDGRVKDDTTRIIADRR